MLAGLLILTIGSGYIFVDTGFTVTNYFVSKDPAKLHSIWIFVLTLIWPAVAAFLYFMVQLVVVVRVLKESKPLSRSIARTSPIPLPLARSPTFLSRSLFAPTYS